MSCADMFCREGGRRLDNLREIMIRNQRFCWHGIVDVEFDRIAAVISRWEADLANGDHALDDLQPGFEDGVALSLSGGGYRAMVFHVGALWRLNEVGLLSKLKRISSVSGGSITAGALAPGAGPPFRSAARKAGMRWASCAPASHDSCVHCVNLAAPAPGRPADGNCRR